MAGSLRGWPARTALRMRRFNHPTYLCVRCGASGAWLRCACVARAGVCPQGACGGRMRRVVSRVVEPVTRAVALAFQPCCSAVSLGAERHRAAGEQASVKAGRWSVVSDSRAAGGRKMRHADGGATKLTTASASPTTTSSSRSRRPPVCRIALAARARRGRRLGQRFGVRAVRRQRDRVGQRHLSDRHDRRRPRSTSKSARDAGSQGLGLAGQRLGKGVLGPEIYFAKTGTQTLRIQTREDGLSIDQILLRPPPTGKAAVRVSASATMTTMTRSEEAGAADEQFAAQGAGLEHPSRRRHRRRL